jgi:LysR family transcriptional regulator for bpeEF and oprC
MDRLDAIQIFVKVVETGSFSMAARSIGVAQSTVSKQIAALETRLGAQLLRRTPKGLNVTEAGQDFYEAAIRLLDDLDTAESRIGHRQASPSGVVRVALSAGFGRIYLVPKLADFYARYPEINVDIIVSERHVNLLEEGIDVAIRIGSLRDSSYVARRIGNCEAATVAAPAYLARRGEPLAPRDLDQHDCVVFTFHGEPHPWHFKDPSGPLAIEPKGLLRCNDAEYIRAGVLAGLGIGHNASWLFAPEISSGAVRRLLHDYTPDVFPISAVYPGGRRISGKVRAFTDFVADLLSKDPHLRIR